jgi:hypothetical protein
MTNYNSKWLRNCYNDDHQNIHSKLNQSWWNIHEASSLEYEVLSSNTKKDQQGLLQIIRHQDKFFSGSGEHLIQAESVLHKWWGISKKQIAQSNEY